MSSTDDTGATGAAETEPAADQPRVLHVDDDPSFAELTASRLEHEGLSVAVETRPADALDRLAAEPFDCIVSDYDMPDMHGLEFLEAAREGEPEPHLPFILFTGKGSEEIASSAISAGVTDYLQKGSGETFELLANRVRNAVGAYRSQVRSDRCRRVVQSLEMPIAAVDGAGTVRATNQSMAELVGRDPATLEGADLSTLVEDAGAVTDAIEGLHDPEDPRSLERTATVATAEGDRRLPMTLNRLRTADDEPAAVCLFGD